MIKYKDIIKKIVEIIEFSKEKKKEFSEEELKDNFSKIMYFDIFNEKAEEFRELLDLEKIFYFVMNGYDITLNNNRLLDFCQNEASKENENTEFFLKLITILNDVKGAPLTELAEIAGYYVLKSDFKEFSFLCEYLKVGPFQKFKDRVGAKEEIYARLNENKKQYSRIKEATEKVDYEKSNLFQYNASEEGRKKPTISSKYKELIYLGFTQKLTFDMVKDVREIMSEEEYEELLNDLSKFGIFSLDEIAELKKFKNATITTINDIDEFIAFMAIRDNLNVYALKQIVISIYGYENYHYFMNKMFQYGKISFEEFMKSVDEVIQKDDTRKA